MIITKSLLMELLMKPLAIWLGCLKTTAKPLVIAIRLSEQKTPATSLVILVLAALSATFPAGAADLLETYHAAQSQDAVFGAARATHRAGQEKLPQGRSLLLPSVNLNANSTYNDNSIQYSGASFITSLLPSGTSRFNSNGYGVNLTQTLFRQQNWVAYTEAGLQVAQADAQFNGAEQDLILRVAQAYFDVLIAQDSVQLA